MLLQYNVGIVGLDVLARAQRSIESGMVQHQRRLNRIVGVSSSRSRAATPGAAAASAKRESAAIDREQQRQLKYWQTAHQRSQDARIREENKRHRVTVRNSEKEARLAAASAKQSLRTRQRFVSGAFGRGAESVKGTLGAVGRFGGAAIGLAGGFAATGAIQERIRDTKLASQLANQAGDPGLKAGLLKEARGVRGFTGDQVLGGIGEFVTKTGDLGTGRQIAGSQAALSLATGANFEDLMATAGQAFNVLKDQISDPVERINELNNLMGVLAQQGALGAVEIRDLAQDFGKLGAATRGFEGKAPDLLRTMGAFAQVAVARGGAESSADASTAASRLVNDMVTHKGRFDALLGPGSLKSKSDPTKLRNPMEIMADVLEKTGGDVMKTSGLFGLESGKIFKGFAATFSEAEKKQRGSGRGAVMAEFNRFAGAELSGKDITNRANSRLEDPDLRLQETVKQFNAAVADKLMPVLMRLIPEFAKLLPFVEQGAKRFGELADAFSQDPVGGLMKLVAAKLAFDIAASSAASAGQKLAQSLTGVASGVGGASTGLGGAITGAQLGISAAAVIIASSLANFEAGEANMTAGGKKLTRLRELTAKAAGGTKLTPEEQAESRGIQVDLGKDVTKAKTPGMVEGVVGEVLSVVKAGGTAYKDAESLLHPSRPTEVATAESFSREADKLIAEQNSAAAKQLMEAAAALKESANATKSPSRADSPSPIKPHS